MLKSSPIISGNCSVFSRLLVKFDGILAPINKNSILTIVPLLSMFLIFFLFLMFLKIYF